MIDVIIIGGGAAGLMAASIASDNAKKVLLIEKNEKLGKKLYITGKGRCNLTNATDVETLLENVPTNPYFLYSSFYNFDSFQTVEYFNSLGLKTKLERGSRVYPASNKSSDVIKVLEKNLLKNNVSILLSTTVEKILIEDNKIKGIIANGKEMLAKKVIIATGGLAYPATGSTGDGYKFAKECGHSVEKTFPSLVPLETKEEWVKDLQGLSLKNVSINILVDNKKIYSAFGEMMFTHFGLTGPIILSSSSYITKELNKNVKLILDLKPALSKNELDERILKDFKKYINKDFSNCLDDLLPKKLIEVIIKLSNINPNKKVNEITKDERKTLVELLKGLQITITKTRDYKEAVITCGGVNVNEIDPSTMQSKFVKGLYFAGEIIDVDGFTGGYNLQIAFSTAYTASKNI